MEHKSTKTERALCDVITSMDAQMKDKDDRIAVLEVEVSRLRDISATLEGCMSKGMVIRKKETA